jgi:selenocysteine-specific elongation factor
MFVLGTAGHVDHGKSALVKLLTGIDPDRLPEEKSRGLTIDLGFAWYTAKNDTPIGIVDVPGHERFVKNMIAGVGAIDFVVFVIAADDGWMPQSAEHLDILRFLGVQHGIIAVNKIDLVKPEWLELVIDDIKDKTKGTFLEHEAIVPVSAVTGEGLAELKAAIDDIIDRLPHREDIGRPRLYIDRAFTMAGRGSVVTGTLIEGSLKVGSEVAIVPSGLRGRIRELQSHKQTVQEIGPGRRVAVNISGVERSDLARGECLVELADAQTHTFVLVHMSLLAESKWSVKTGRKLLALLGTAEPEAACRLLDTDEIKPGQSAICELRLGHPVKARLGDRFVLRLPTPGVTIGGGQVLDFPAHRVTRSNEAYLELLHRRAADLSLPVILSTEMVKQGWLPKKMPVADLPFSNAAIEKQIEEFIADGTWTAVADGYIDARASEALKKQALEIMRERHRAQPYVYGYNESEWRDKLRVPETLFKALLASWLADGVIGVNQGRYHLPDFAPGLPEKWRGEAAILQKLIVDGGMAPPVRAELEAKGGNARDILNFWFSAGEMVSLPDGVIYPRAVYDAAVAKIRDFCKANATITVAQVRDLLGTTRKYVVPLLTYMDEQGLTRREGDFRRWIGKD